MLEKIKELSLTTKLLAACLVVGLVGGLFVVSAVVGEGESPSAHSEVGDSLMGEESDLQRCVILWNKPSNDYARELASGYSEQSPYVNVDFAASFPDRCVITTANIDMGRAFQFIEGGQGSSGELGPFGFPAAEPEIHSLEVEWNAESDGQGYLTLAP